MNKKKKRINLKKIEKELMEAARFQDNYDL
jgi:hypothetical protein